MTKRPSRILLAGAALLVASSLAGPARAQQLQDQVITASYLHVNPQQANAWLKTFKKHLYPALEELREEGALLGWHLIVPGIHHPGGNWSYALVLGHKDRAAQGVVEKKLQEAIAGMPESQVKMFFGAMELSQHYDDEWREVDMASIEVPEEEEQAEGEEQEEEKD